MRQKSRPGVDRIVEEPASRSMLGRKLTAKATELDGQVILDDLGRRCVTRSVARQLFAERVEAEQRRREVERQREADAIELEARNRPRGGVPVYNPLVPRPGWSTMPTSDVARRHRNELADQPWLRPFIDDGDDNLEPAKSRWETAQLEARIALRHKGVQLHRTMTTANGLRTTALLVNAEGEAR